MTNGDVIKAILKPRTDQIRIYSTWVEIEIQSLSINFSCELSWWNAEYKESNTKNNLGVEKIIDEIEKEFEKVDIPIMDKLTLFAKVQNSLYKCAELRNSEIPVGSTTKNDLGIDCVSRAYLLDDSKYHTVFNNDTGNFEDVVYREDIEKAPSVTPQPRKGHWIFDGDCLICSKCKKAYSFSGSNFCPNCGADMVEREADNGNDDCRTY